MKPAQRSKAVQMLREIWKRRDVPAIPAEELDKLSDNTVGYLLRFWTHKDRQWADEHDEVAHTRQTDFAEEPPQGYTAVRDSKPPEPATLSDSRNAARVFKTPAGGYLTPRQSAVRNRS